MVSERDNQQEHLSNEYLEFTAMTRLGERSDQQDCYGYIIYPKETLLVLCDGMGGHAAGRRASQTAVETILNIYDGYDFPDNPVEVLKKALIDANNAICDFKDENGNPMHSGSTCVSVLIRERKLYWCSAGDSRAYLIRGNDHVQLTLDHNYKTVLDEKKEAGLITEEEYNSELDKGESLISFLGIGELSLLDYCDNPIQLKQDDRIVIMSDGVYRLISDNDISQIAGNFFSTDDVAQVFETKMLRTEREDGYEKDNATIFIVKII